MNTVRHVGAVAAAALVLMYTGAGVEQAVATQPTGAAASAARPDVPAGVPYYAGKLNPEVNTLRYNLSLRWDGRALSGSASVVFQTTRTTSTVRLDLLHSLRVSKVDLDGRPIGFTHLQNGLAMNVGHLVRGVHHTFTIEYSGIPHSVTAPSRRGDFAEGLGWQTDPQGHVYTFQEPFGAFTWYPVNDYPADKAFYDAQITVPSTDVAVFNGALTGRSPAGPGMTTYRWHMGRPAASYLTTIAIGPYTGYHDTMPNGTPAVYWLLPRDRSVLPRLEYQARDAFSWLQRHAGPYPFDRFGVVVVAGSSAMETQTLVTMSRKTLDRPDAVVEHEMAHQWFGDAVTPTKWQGLWLNEGWAMWMQQAYEKYRGGYQYLGGMKNWRYYDVQSRRTCGPPGHYNPRTFGALNVYLGPAMMLNRIRVQIGPVEFLKLAKAWVAEHEYGHVSRDEFIRWVNAQTGQNFTSLINLWLDSPRTPR
ncbi:MAG: M1 family metallopeptidase [Nocardioidaceae bacterium]